jgi:pimeloyl-ACP methyl ester carboxylesterase
MEAFPNSYAADWIDSLPNESLEQYAVRWAEIIRSELEKRSLAPIIVCGVSLGGMMAPYVARQLNANGCVLLCSIRRPKEFPKRYYFDWCIMRHCFPLRMVRIFLLQLVARLFLHLPGLRQRSVVFDVIQQMTEMPTQRFANLARMMFDWAYRCRKETTEEPIFLGTTLQVHGTRDLLLPIRLTNPDIRVLGGGHDLTMTHPAQINEILEGFVQRMG